MDSVIVFHGQSFLICYRDWLGVRPIFVAKEPIHVVNHSPGAITPPDLLYWLRGIIRFIIPGVNFTLKDPEIWNITVDKRGLNDSPDTIRFWYRGSLEWGGRVYVLEQFKEMPVYEADLLEKLRLFIGLI